MTLKATDPKTLNAWDVFLQVSVPLGGLVAAIAAIIVSYQISRISDLGSDIKNVNSRIDQIYPLIAQSTSDLGFIKGSLEATAQKFAIAAEKNELLTKQLTAINSSQESQRNDIKNMNTALNTLIVSIGIQKTQIDEIRIKINSSQNFQKNNYFSTGSTVFSPKNIAEMVSEGSPNMKVIPLNWGDAKSTIQFFKNIESSNIDFGKIVLLTDDANVAARLKEGLYKAGIVDQK